MIQTQNVPEAQLPAQPEIIQLGRAHYAVGSSSHPGGHYTVDLGRTTCSCPHHIYRAAVCKHIKAARAQVAREMAAQLDTQQIFSLLQRGTLPTEILEALAAEDQSRSFGALTQAAADLGGC